MNKENLTAQEVNAYINKLEMLAAELNKKPTEEEDKSSADVAPSDVVALLATGQLPEMADKILDEAARRWGQEPRAYTSYSEEAQNIKQIKAELKRLRRSTTKHRNLHDTQDSGFMPSSDSMRIGEGRE